MRGRAAATGYSSRLDFYPRREWAATGIVVCQSVCLFVTRGAWAATGIVVCQSVCYPRRAWTATGIVVVWFVCDTRVCSPGCHSTAFTAWIAFTQQVVSLVVADLDVKALLSNKS